MSRFPPTECPGSPFGSPLIPLLSWLSGYLMKWQSCTEGWFMASEIPLVRFFVACRAVIVDPSRKKYTLQDLIHAIVRLPGEPFPCIRTEMALFALLTNGRG